MADSEKITVNLSAVDLGRIDLLAEEGFYASRADFIRSAIRKELDLQRDQVERTAARRQAVLGVLVHTRDSLEACRERRQQLALHVVGAVQLGDDVTPDLARSTIRSLKVHGALRASPEVKAALADRMG